MGIEDGIQSADYDLVPGMKLSRDVDAHSIHQRAIAAVEILDEVDPLVMMNTGMAARCAVVIDDDVRLWRAAEHERLTVEGNNAPIGTVRLNHKAWHKSKTPHACVTE